MECIKICIGDKMLIAQLSNGLWDIAFISKDDKKLLEIERAEYNVVKMMLLVAIESPK